MKIFARLILVSAAISGAVSAAPFLAVGDGAELFVTGTIGIRADDNIYLTDKPVSDTIFDINPGVELTFGKNAALKGSLTLVDSFANYADNSNLNTNLFSGDLNTVYDDAKLKLKFNVGFHELNQNAPDIRGLTRRDQFVTGGSAEVEVSQITSLGAGISFDHTNYKRKNYGDSDTLTIPLNFYYKWTPKVDLSVGYRYRDYETTVGSDSTDHFFSVGARGEFTPLLSGQVNFGYNERRISRGGSEAQPGLDASLTYLLTPKTSITLGASNDYGTAPQGAQQKNFSLNGSATAEISSEWKLNAGLSYRGINYFKDVRPRTDDYIEGSLGAIYVINTYAKIVGSYTFRDNSSDLRNSEFKNNVFSISATLRY